MSLQYTDLSGIGDLYINDAGEVTLNGVKKPAATVIEGTDDALKVSVDGQDILIGWDEHTVPLSDVEPPPAGSVGEDVAVLLQALEKHLPGITAQFQNMASPPTWDKDTEYRSGYHVQFKGKYWYALPDVAVGYPPDDIYDLSTQTGGWAPL